MKLKYQWPLVWCLLLLVPLRDVLSLSATDNSLQPHLLWPLVHANIIHWLLNTIGFMVLWRCVTAPRLFWGYVSSVVIGYFWVMLQEFFGEDTGIRLCGLSGIILFLIGCIFLNMKKAGRIRFAVLVAVSCFIPGIAASVHILSALIGIVYSYCIRRLSCKRRHQQIIMY